MRCTHRYVTKSGSSATDGVGKMWLNGTLILAVEQSKVNVDPPNRQTGSQKWCLSADIADFFSNVAVDRLTLGSVNAGPLWGFAIDWDNMRMWRD
jgi:hypothetical protein